jgi:hypothetical protein
MTTPPELRWQAQRLRAEAERNTGGAEKRILLDLATRLAEAAAALEQEEGGTGPMTAAAQIGRCSGSIH